MIKNNLQYKRILILGAGQIGFAIAREIVKYKPQLLVLHVHKKEELKKIINNLKKISVDGIDIRFSTGNIFFPYDMSKLDEKNLTLKDLDRLIDYFYSDVDEKQLKKSTLYNIIKNYTPDLIIDSINTSTVLGNYFNLGHNPFKKNKENNYSVELKKLMFGDFNVKLINFVLSLKLGTEKHNVRKYVKISTTALGGMGLDMNFTHGDSAQRYCLSNALFGKIAATGVLHALLLSLAHTKNFDINVIVPATCVGWEEVLIDDVKNNLGLITEVDSKKLIKLENGKTIKELIFNNSKRQKNKTIKIPLVYSGENKAYALDEITVLASYGQMEAITKEEVADSVMKCVFGTSNNDLLKMMDLASLRPTFKGKNIRDKVIKELKYQEGKSKIDSIATGNLGPTVAKHLFELRLLKLVSNGSLVNIIETKSESLALKMRKEINTNSRVRKQILSIGLPILVHDSQLIIGDKYLIPDVNEDCVIKRQNIERWSQSGWIDLRSKNIRKWQKIIIQIVKDIKNKKDDAGINLEGDISVVKDGFDVGELLGYYYNFLGGGRRNY